MGWNAGGFGHMTFETADGSTAWHAAEVSHDQWTDWTDWFASAVAPKFVVSQQLATLRALHAPTESTYLVIDEQGTKVDFAFETGEDTFREFSGTIAALLRAAARHGARGTFYFLGTAGAERDFTYKLELANGESTIESLHPDEVAMVYEGEEYQAFLQRVMEALGISAEGDRVEASAKPKAGRNPFVAPVAVEVVDEEAAETAPEDVAEDVSPAKPVKPAKEPAAKTVKTKPAAKKPAAKSAAKTVKKPVAKKPIAKKPATKKPAAKKPAAKKKR